MATGVRRCRVSAQEQGRGSLRGLQPAHTRVLGGYNRVRATFKSTCSLCSSIITKGTLIRFDIAVGKFVHESCARVQQVPTLAAASQVPLGPTQLPTGVKPATLRGYATGWARYEALTKRLGHVAIPGRDCPWDMQLLWSYMSFRGRTCRPQTVTAGLSALAYFGVRYNQLLPTSSHDSNSLMYRQLTLLKQQLALDYNRRCGGVRYGPSQCTPLGQRTVSLLLSAFAVKDQESFQRLSRMNRHHVAGNHSDATLRNNVFWPFFS